MVILGLWVAVIGYGIAYTGYQKLAGDASYSLGKSFRGVAPVIAPAASSGTSAGAAQVAAYHAQGSTIPQTPIGQAA